MAKELVLNSKGVPLRHVVLDKENKPIILNEWKQERCDYQEEYILNALGFDIPITTMTTIAQKVTYQKFATIPDWATYLPVVEGQGAFGDSVQTLRAVELNSSFEQGIMNTGQNNAREMSGDVGVDSVRVPIYSWANKCTWDLFKLENALKAGNWNIVEALQKARKRIWDLGIQRIAFLGAQGFQTAQANCYGLLNLPNVNTDTSVFAASGNVPISQMTPAQLNAFVANLINLYRTNNNRTADPTHFLVPEFDFLGMATQYSAVFPSRTILEVLETAFKAQAPGFKGIKRLFYGMASLSFGALSLDTYVLLNHDDETLNMQIPVPFQTTTPSSIDGFTLQDVGYGQYTGVVAFRPREILYLTGGFAH